MLFIIRTLLKLTGKLLEKPVRFGSVVLAGLAVEQELRKPRELRTWRGQVGPVPYDLRPPTVDRFKQSVWNPSNPAVFTSTAFGVGWSVNAASIAQRLGLLRDSTATS